MNIIEVLLRSIAAVVIGTLIGSERMRHGRAAGMRTHILVCLGACMTSMTSMFVSDVLGNNGTGGIGHRLFGRGNDNP